ncbi:four-carbon acid sugar kinase family protein [Salipiger mangrovisoli]|uniref:Four-carbon acid sugar kinase family protein n=1 Tax=Salipiger mangrovisoli TaxID=2865933 RepID=A0ABR9X4Q3_9RHOB|nr:four-carbon acid sugar kinase family protein [Salipiger mangrovisoli]MBE9638578.1 four-carbon acid sugar kinase family protein [Salipiger mangrovisoli]
MRKRVHIVADDLTGALDSAATFAARGARVRVACRPADLPEALASGAEVIAVATGTRDGSEARAIDVLRQVAHDLAGHDGILFKKIDSRLKGHIGAELAQLAPPDTPLVANPAIPKLGRFCLDGAVTGAGVPDPIPVAPHIGRAISVSDARTQEDLAAQLPAELGRTVLVGAAGLAETLALRLWPHPAPCAPTRLELPALLAIGSRDPVTVAQIDALQAVPVLEAPNGELDPLPLPTEAPLALVRMTAGPVPVSGAEAGAAFAKTVAKMQARMQPATLFACGGESAAALLERLGIGQLDVLGELLPGVPVSRSANGQRLTLVTKSGGFGAADTLVKLVKMLTND